MHVQKAAKGAYGANPLKNEPSGEDDDGFGWMVSILPYIEQQALYDLINPNGHFGVLGNQTIRRPGLPRDIVGQVFRGGDRIVSHLSMPVISAAGRVPANWLFPEANSSEVGLFQTLSDCLSDMRLLDYKGAGGKLLW